MNQSKFKLKIAIATATTVIMVAVLTLTFNKDIQAQTLLDTTAATSIDASLQTAPAVNATNVRDRIRADMLQNTKTAEETRRAILENNRVASSSPKMLVPNVKKVENRIENRIEQKVENRIEQKIEGRIENRNDDKDDDGDDNRNGERLEKCLGSTNPNEKCFRPEIKPNDKQGYEDNGRSMQMKLLKERKEMVAKQINVALKNLEELRKRIGSRMEKDRLANKNMSAVIELVKIADSKIALAKEAVAKLRSYEPIASSTGTTTAPVNLAQVRGLIDNAQKSIKEAHRALTDVVVAIAKISGINKERTASSTPIRNVVPSPVTSIPASTN